VCAPGVNALGAPTALPYRSKCLLPVMRSPGEGAAPRNRMLTGTGWHYTGGACFSQHTCFTAFRKFSCIHQPYTIYLPSRISTETFFTRPTPGPAAYFSCVTRHQTSVGGGIRRNYTEYRRRYTIQCSCSSRSCCNVAWYVVLTHSRQGEWR